jgi:O-antigen/teichoic acid export membrane protein
MAVGEQPVRPTTPPTHVGARRASIDVAIQIVGRIGNLALGVVVTLVIVRTLGAHGFGEWSTIFAISQIATNFGELGLGQVAMNRAASEPGRTPDWLGALLSLRLILALPVMLVSMLVVLLVIPTSQGKIAGLIVSVTLLIGAPSAIRVVFQLNVRNDIGIAIMTLNSILWAIAVVVIAASSGKIVAFATLFLAITVLTTIATLAWALRMSPVHLRHVRDLWRDLMRVGVAVGIAGALVTCYVWLDQILVLDLAGSREAGLYGSVYRILEQVQFIPIALMTTLLPLIASSYPRNLELVRKLLQMAAEYLSIASLPILMFTIVDAHSIILLLFGREFLAAAPALPVLMAAFVFVSFGYVTGGMVVLLNLQRLFVIYAAIALVVNAGLNLLLIPAYGFMAAAWITLITEVLVMSLATYTITKRLEMRPSLDRFIRTIAATLIMGLATWLAQAAGAPLIPLIIIAGVSYLLGIALLGVLSIDEVKALLSNEPLASRDSAIHDTP